MEGSAVTAATGALGPVLAELTKLLTVEDKIPEGIRMDIEFIRSELEPVHSLLLKIWEREDLGAECMDWMMDARDLSYTMEDDIDDFKHGLEHGNNSILQQRSNVNPFKSLKREVQRLVGRCSEKWKMDTDTITTSHSKLNKDPQSRFLHKDASELLEIEKKKDELIKLLYHRGTICIVGFAGMGKTTLADLVYRAIGETFECRVFVSLSPTQNMVEVLQAIITHLNCSVPLTDTDPLDKLTDNIRNFLTDKRYLIVVDDIWHCKELELITESLPKNNLDSRIIMTTRINSVADRCRTGNDAFVYVIASLSFDAAEALSKRIIQESGKASIIPSAAHNPCYSIAKISSGMPLAITCLSSAVEEQLPTEEVEDSKQYTVAYERFEVALSQALQGFLYMSCMKPLVESLCLGYHYLPLDLKTCLLYCSIYAPDQMFERDDLTRIWIAERFVYKEEKAQSYFYELINCGFIRPVERRCTEVQKYEINGTILAFLKCQSSKHNFVVSLGIFSNTSSQYARRIHRLSIHGRLSQSDIGRFDFSHARSFAIFGHANLVPLEHVKRLRILLLDEQCSSENVSSGDDGPNSGMDNIIQNLGQDNRSNRGELLLPSPWHLVQKRCENPVLKQKNEEITVLPREIEELHHLEILNISNTRNQRLPREIGKLRLLKSLNVSNTKVKVLPHEIEELQLLMTLNMSNTKLMGIPREIWKLQLLEILDVNNTLITELPEDIGKLQFLKNLNVSNTKVKVIPREIGKLQCLETLNISNTEVAKLPKDLREVQLLKNLNLSNTKVTELQQEIVKMKYLETLDISNTVIAELPGDIKMMEHLKALNLSGTNVTNLPEEIGKLQNLKTMDICKTKVTELPRGISELKSLVTLDVRDSNVKELPWEACGLSNLVVVLGNKGSHQVLKLPRLPYKSDNILHSSSVGECREDLSVILFGHSCMKWEPLSVGRFKITRRHMNVPNWVKDYFVDISSLDIRLWKLEDNLEFLSQMPYLQILVIQIELLPRKTILISCGGFTRLESFYVDCRLPRVTFQPGAMPKLKHLEFKCYTGRGKEDRLGIKHLPELQRVVLLCSEWYRSATPGLSAIASRVKKEAEEHHNRITVCINGTEEVIEAKKMSADICEENCINGAGGSRDETNVMVAKAQSLLPGNDIDDKGNIIPVRSYYPFGLTD